MARKRKSYFKPRTNKLSVRLQPVHYQLVEEAAEKAGLALSSFIIMLLVRLRILPETCMDDLRRKPIAFFRELHDLLRVVNNIGGNCKQLLAAMPELAALCPTQVSINRAVSVITDALQGKPIPASVELDVLEAELTKEGYYLNDIARSVNMEKPQLSYLPTVLASIRDTADRLVVGFTGKPVTDGEMAYVKDIAEEAMEEMRSYMRKAAAKQTKNNKGDD